MCGCSNRFVDTQPGSWTEVLLNTTRGSLKTIRSGVEPDTVVFSVVAEETAGFSEA